MSSPTHLSSLRHSSLSESKAGPWGGLVIAVLLIFVIVATIGTVRSNAKQQKTAVAARATADMTTIDNRMATYEELLYGVRAAFRLDPDLDRQEFHDLVNSLTVDTRLPGVQVIGVAHIVEQKRIDDWSAQVDEDVMASRLSYPEFEIHPWTGRRLVMPINYIEPQVGNLQAFGFDFLSESSRRTAALKARDTGESVASAPVTLVQESATQKALLVYVPLYREGAVTETVAQRREAFTGVVYAAFRMDDLLNGVLGPEAGEISVIDVAANEYLTGGTEISRSDSEMAALRTTSDGRVGEFDVSGRLWRVMVHSDADALSNVERAVPFATAFAGILVAGLLVALVLSMRSARSRAIVLAKEMTVELEALTESASEGIVTVDEHGMIVAWNHAASQVFGGSAEEMIGRNGNELVPEATRQAFDAAFAKSMEGSGSDVKRQSIVGVGRRSDGSEFPAEVSMSLWSARGSRFSTGFVRDVTKRVETENRIAETTNLLLGVLGAVTEMSVIGTDEVGTVTVFNAGAERMLGYRAEDVIGKIAAGTFHLDSEVATRAAEIGVEPGFDVFVTAPRQGFAETLEWTYVRADGTQLPVDLTVTPRHDANGKLCGFIGVAIDITDRLEASQQQAGLLDQEREMVAKLTELDRAKSDFVQTMSHELRTPLTSIIGYSELLADELAELDAAQSSIMVSLIEKNANRLLLLVEDLLTLARIESGTLHATLEPCDLGDLLRTAEQSVASIARTQGVEVDLDVAGLLEINGDAPELERVFLNLLSNAVKFSHRGGAIEVFAVQSLDGGEVVVTVNDHGIGIPEDEQSELFARFFRSRNAEEYAIQGSGLGLSIVADIVERHGGTIDIESEEGVGTTATVRLPSHDPETDAGMITDQAFA